MAGGLREGSSLDVAMDVAMDDARMDGVIQGLNRGLNMLSGQLFSSRVSRDRFKDAVNPKFEVPKAKTLEAYTRNPLGFRARGIRVPGAFRCPMRSVGVFGFRV